MSELAPRAVSLEGEISKAIVRLLAGRGPVRARTTIGSDFVACVMGATLTKGEQSLVSGNEAEVVLDGRRAHQQVFRQAAIDAVEGLACRTVLAFMSCYHIDPDLAVAVFGLAPLAGLEGVDPHGG